MSDDLNPVHPSLSRLRGELAHALSGSGEQRQLFFCLVITICALVVLVHLPALSRQALMYDDQMYVTENPLVQNPSWESAGRVFAEVWRPSTVLGYYHPLAMVSLMLDRFLTGPYENMRTYHRTSLALHVANTALVAIFLYLLFPQPVVAAVVALLFGLHPITVDSVCWLSERKTVLSSFFALWALIAYVRFTRERKVRQYVACLAAYVLALLSKPIALPLPFMILLLDVWPLNRFRWKSVTEKLPLFGVAGVFTVITYISQLHSGSIRLPGQYEPLQAPLAMCQNVIFYVGKLLWPVNMSPHYDPGGPIDPSNPTVMITVAAACALISLLVLSVHWTRAFSVGCLISFVMLLPASGIVSHTIVLVANRYLYLPSVGLLQLVAWALTKLLAASANTRIRWTHLGVATVLLLLLSGETMATRGYLHHWRDTRVLYEYMLSMFPNSAALHCDLGTALRSQGKRAEAVEHYRAAVHCDPMSFRAWYNLALTSDELNDASDKVTGCYRRALWINPSFPTAHMNLALVLFRTGIYNEALTHFQKAVELGPEFALARYNLGRALVVSGKAREGLSHLRMATQVNPRFILAWKEVAWLLATHPDAQVRDPNEAIKVGEHARLMTRDGNAGVLDVLAAAYASGGQYRKAVETARKALAVAKRLGADELAGQIEDRLVVYQHECPYYEDPRVQLDRMIAEAKKREQAADNSQSEIQNPKFEDTRREVRDGAETISAE